MTDNAEREAFKKILPCHPDVYWHEIMNRWVTNGAYLLEAHAYNCQWEGFQAGRAVARTEEPTPLETAVKWVLNDAMYKAPEQIGEVPSRWLERLRAAIAVTDKGETK